MRVHVTRGECGTVSWQVIYKNQIKTFKEEARENGNPNVSLGANLNSNWSHDEKAQELKAPQGRQNISRWIGGKASRAVNHARKYFLSTFASSLTFQTRWLTKSTRNVLYIKFTNLTCDKSKASQLCFTVYARQYTTCKIILLNFLLDLWACCRVIRLNASFLLFQNLIALQWYINSLGFTLSWMKRVIQI